MTQQDTPTRFSGWGPAPLVLLHGFTGAPESFDGLCSCLATARVVRPAILGHVPRQTEEPEPETFLEEVERLARVLGPLELGRAHILGYSLGARLALALLWRHPELFASATLVGLHPGLTDEADRARRRHSDAEWCRLLATEGLVAFVNAWEQQPLFATQARLPPRSREVQRAIRLGHRSNGLIRALQVLGLGAMPDLRSQLGTIEQPIQLVVGELDPKFLTIAERTEQLLPRAKLRVLPGVGHNPLLESPAALAEVVSQGLAL